MKHHIIVKFLAVFLCAASLLGIVGSGLGIFAMTELGLRDRTLEEAYADSVESTAEALAAELAVRYASRELGGAGEALVDNYYGSYWLDSTFDWDQVGYTIRDAGGGILEAQIPAEATGTPALYSFQQEGSYLNVLNVMTEEEYEERYYPATEPVYPTTEPDSELTVYNAVPVEGCKIFVIFMDYADGSSCAYEAAEGGYLGQLSYYTSNQLIFQAQSDYADITRLFEDLSQSAPVGMQCLNTDGEIVLEIGHPGGILEEFSKNHGDAYFLLRPLDEAVRLPSVYDAIPQEGQAVTRLSVTYADGCEESVGGTPDIGWIRYDDEGNVVFTASTPDLLVYRTEQVIYISFSDEDGNLVYEAYDTDGVGAFSLEEDDLLFRAGESSGLDSSPGADEGIYIYDDVPPGGYTVCHMELWLEDASRGLVIEDAEGLLGHVDHDSSGNVIFTAKNWQDFVFSKPARVVYILMENEDGRLLYEARQEGVPTGSGCVIGTFAYDEAGALVFRRSEAVPALASMAVETPVPATAAEEETVPETVEATAAFDEGETAENPDETPEVTEPSMAEETREAVTVPTVAEETEMPTEPPYALDTADVTEPRVESTLPPTTTPYEIAVAADNLRVYGYYDNSTGEHMIVEYTYEQMPSYTVDIVLGSGALQYQYEWVLMELVYFLKDYLIPILVVSLLLFAVTAVYLCCSAGRRPGSDEIRAGGLNCISLDLYLAAAVGGVVCCALAIVEGGDYLLRQDVQTGILFAILCAYAACLLIVGFCFAFAAQVKTPDGYWWHNSICGRSVKLLARLWRIFPALFRWLWKFTDEKLEPLMVRIAKAAWKLTKFFWLQLKKGVTWLCRKALQSCDWMSRTLGRFFSMLPLTWQFLVTGFCLVVFLYIMIRTYKVGYILIGFGVFFGVILYAASAFGILLENAKRMRKGDLDSKVDSKLLIGGFREFAEELNGLADVAVVAAQKQLKSERMKTELITNVSHDIKTPLTSIINYVDLMEKPHSPEEQAAYLEVLSRQSQRLKKLIDDLMEMSKASTGNMAVEITRVDAAEAVNQALGEFADKLDRAQLIPVFRQPEKDIRMMADGRLVWRVLSNVLSNAVKYALPGTRVYIDLMELEGKVVLSLKNISREPLNVSADELLERFVRGDTARNTEGSGLGLNIAQSLMELQKGKLELLVDGDLFKVTLIFPGA